MTVDSEIVSTCSTCKVVRDVELTDDDIVEDVVELSHRPDKVFHRRLQIVKFPLVLQKLVVFSRTVYAQFGDELLTKPAKVKSRNTRYSF